MPDAPVSLTPLQAWYIGLLLSRPGSSHRGRKDIGRSTVQKLDKWVGRCRIAREIYIPNPAMLGVRRMTVMVLGGTPVSALSSLRGLASSPRTVLLWMDGLGALVVALHSPGELEANFSLIQAEVRTKGGRIRLLALDVEHPTLPVYFDYRRLWRRWTGYGQADLPLSFPSWKEIDLPDSRSALLHLLDERDERGYWRMRAQARMIAREGVAPRGLLALQMPMCFESISAKRVEVVFGELSDGVRADQLLKVMVDADGRTPFLFASNGGQVVAADVDLDGSNALARSLSASGGELWTRRDAFEFPVRDLRQVIDHDYLTMAQGLPSRSVNLPEQDGLSTLV